eukprot:CAMPEP_0196591266 /NCGR_PEP_ID=MMETSP1081-20130531/69009_1 /TAXON_ID=36882 /ORGANISM="Pyramimonas amylifera, Strain CCMP720" /LENGTH=125 /DNA_ID=CAMNT_0041914575 /DNA_START=180 /DNA_END=558 /DNA_ORIENTATION=-
MIDSIGHGVRVHLTLSSEGEGKEEEHHFRHHSKWVSGNKHGVPEPSEPVGAAASTAEGVPGIANYLSEAPAAYMTATHTSPCTSGTELTTASRQWVRANHWTKAVNTPDRTKPVAACTTSNTEQN